MKKKQLWNNVLGLHPSHAFSPWLWTLKKKFEKKQSQHKPKDAREAFKQGRYSYLEDNPSSTIIICSESCYTNFSYYFHKANNWRRKMYMENGSNIVETLLTHEKKWCKTTWRRRTTDSQRENNECMRSSLLLFTSSITYADFLHIYFVPHAPS